MGNVNVCGKCGTILEVGSYENETGDRLLPHTCQGDAAWKCAVVIVKGIRERGCLYLDDDTAVPIAARHVRAYGRVVLELEHDEKVLLARRETAHSLTALREKAQAVEDAKNKKDSWLMEIHNDGEEKLDEAIDALAAALKEAREDV